MTQQQESRWSLNSTGNRVMYAVAAGVLVSLFAGAAGLHGTGRVLVFALAGLLTYGLVTALRR